MEKPLESVADLKKAKALEQPHFERAKLIFEESIKNYQAIEDKLQESIKWTVVQFCQMFADIQVRLEKSPSCKNYVVEEIVLNDDLLVEVTAEFMENVEQVRDITGMKTYRQDDDNGSGFSYFLLDDSQGSIILDDNDYTDNEFCIVIPNKYLGANGMDLMAEDVKRITEKLDEMDANWDMIPHVDLSDNHP